MTDKVTLTFFHNPRSQKGRDKIIDASIDFFEDLKIRGYDVFDFVAGSYPYKEEEESSE